MPDGLLETRIEALSAQKTHLVRESAAVDDSANQENGEAQPFASEVMAVATESMGRNAGAEHVIDVSRNVVSHVAEQRDAIAHEASVDIRNLQGVASEQNAEMAAARNTFQLILDTAEQERWQIRPEIAHRCDHYEFEFRCLRDVSAQYTETEANLDPRVLNVEALAEARVKDAEARLQYVESKSQTAGSSNCELWATSVAKDQEIAILTSQLALFNARYDVHECEQYDRVKVDYLLQLDKVSNNMHDHQQTVYEQNDIVDDLNNNITS